MAARGCVLHLPTGLEGLAPKLILEYAEDNEGKCIVKPTTGCLLLETSGGQTFTGRNTICRHLASLGKQKHQLLGSNSEQAAEVSQWLSYSYTNLHSLTDDALLMLNETLKSRMFLVGDSLTLADMVVYAVVHPAVSADSQKIFPCLELKLPLFNFAAHSSIAISQPKGTDVASKSKNIENSGPSVGDHPSPPTNATRGNAGASNPKKEAKESDSQPGQESKAECKKQKKEKPAKDPPKKINSEPRIDMLDLRIGKILDVKPHPNADSLYLEMIDVGEDAPRQVISGLVKFVPIDAMMDRMVIVCCNLQPAMMRGISSNGMVMCASDQNHEKCDPLIPPAGVAIGEKVTFEGFENLPLEIIKPKQKLLEKLFPDLVTDAEGIPNYKGVPFQSSAGSITSTISSGFVR